MSYRLVFVFNFVLIILLMKYVSWLLHPKIRRENLFKFIFKSPLLSARNYQSSQQHKELFHFIILKLFLSGLYLSLIILVAREMLQPLNYFKVILISPIIYFLTEFCGSLGQLMFYPLSIKIPPIHRHPLISKSLGEFWGRRWNIWVQDWLRDVSRYQRKSLIAKLFVTFLISGIFHEIMGNLPFLICFKRSHFGNMTLYFVIQGLGLWIEKKWVWKFPLTIHRLYLWLVVLLPAPLFINYPILLFFGILE